MTNSIRHIPVYVINLDRRPDRWARVEQTLKDQKFQTFQRVVAVDGKEIDSEQVKYLLEPNTYNGLGKPRGLWNMTNITTLGAVGCSLSHYKVWQEILESQTPSIVMEDDIKFTPVFQNNAIIALEYLDRYDLVVLGSYECANEKAKPLYIKTFTSRQLSGTHFYYLSPRGAAFLIAHALPLTYQVDVFMGKCARLESPDFVCGIVNQNLATQWNDSTDIQSGNLALPVWGLVIIVLVIVVIILCGVFRRRLNLKHDTISAP